MSPPVHCPKPVQFNALPQEDEEETSDFFEDEEWKRKKRSVPDIRDADFESMEKPKGGFVDCTCNWGLFRDRNVTLREPVGYLNSFKPVYVYLYLNFGAGCYVSRHVGYTEKRLGQGV